MAGAEPIYLPCTAETGHLPDFTGLPTDVLDRTTVAYICSPANPQGAVADRAYWKTLLDLAERHDFRVFADECYPEIYRDAPPTGALEVASGTGAQPGSAGGVPLALQTLESGRVAVGLRRNRGGKHGADETTAVLCRGADADPGAVCCRGNMGRRNACCGQSGALSGESDARR